MTRASKPQEITLRDAALSKMCHKLKQRFDTDWERLRKSDQRSVAAHYQIARTILDIESDTTYGVDGLHYYLVGMDISVTNARLYKAWARNMTPEQLETFLTAEGPAKANVTTTMMMQVARLPKAADRKQMLALVCQGYTTEMVRNEVSTRLQLDAATRSNAETDEDGEDGDDAESQAGGSRKPRINPAKTLTSLEATSKKADALLVELVDINLPSWAKDTEMSDQLRELIDRVRVSIHLLEDKLRRAEKALADTLNSVDGAAHDDDEDDEGDETAADDTEETGDRVPLRTTRASDKKSGQRRDKAGKAKTGKNKKRKVATASLPRRGRK